MDIEIFQDRTKMHPHRRLSTVNVLPRDRSHDGAVLIDQPRDFQGLDSQLADTVHLGFYPVEHLPQMRPARLLREGGVKQIVKTTKLCPFGKRRVWRGQRRLRIQLTVQLLQQRRIRTNGQHLDKVGFHGLANEARILNLAQGNPSNEGAALMPDLQ